MILYVSGSGVWLWKGGLLIGEQDLAVPLKESGKITERLCKQLTPTTLWAQETGDGKPRSGQEATQGAEPGERCRATEPQQSPASGV